MRARVRKKTAEAERVEPTDWENEPDLEFRGRLYSHVLASVDC